MVTIRSLPSLAFALAIGLTINALPAWADRVSAAPDGRRPALLVPGEPAAKAKQASSSADSPEGRAATIRRLQRAYDDTLSELDRDHAGSATQALQKKIVQDLDRLINQPPPPQNPGAKPAPRPQQPNDADVSPDTPPRPASRAKPQARGDAPAVQNQDRPPSTAKNLPASLPGAATAKGNGLPPGTEMWAPKLPGQQPVIADAFAQDHCLPQYEELLRRYYRAIAEEVRHKQAR